MTNHGMAQRPDLPGSPNDGERGSITLWVLGLCVGLLFLGGLSTDLWRAYSERRALAGMADSAAIAGASGVDQSDVRGAHGQPLLDPQLAERLAQEHLLRQTDTRSLTGAEVAATPEQITVALTGAVEFTLLRIFMAAEPFHIQVTATSGPRRSE